MKNERFIPAKRQAVDGRVWWCIIDRKTGKWSSRSSPTFRVIEFGAVCAQMQAITTRTVFATRISRLNGIIGTQIDFLAIDSQTF